VAYAIAHGVLGSVDANRGDYQNGWDTDQFPNSVDELSLAVYEIVRAGGFTTGGFNFDTKLRRQSMGRTDLFHAHIGGIDTLARSLLVAAGMIESGELERRRSERYAGWNGDLGRSVLSGDAILETLATRVFAGEIDPRPVSGRQELLENLVNQQIWAADQATRAEAGADR
jgi:Xylose isomerase